MIPVKDLHQKEYCHKTIAMLSSRSRYENKEDKEETEHSINYYKEMLKYYK